MEMSRVSSKGQVTIPKSIRELLKLDEGDRVAFIVEDGKVFITRASEVTLRELQAGIAIDMEEHGITEEDVLEELENIRKELWDERNKR